MRYNIEVYIPLISRLLNLSDTERSTSLESVTLLSRAKLGHGVFRECPSLKTINVPSDYVDYYKELLPEEFKQLVVGFINDENS